MKVSIQSLKAWVDPGQDISALCESLTQAGLEIESVTPVAADFSGVYVAEVLSTQQHPNADRLSVCQVFDGEETLEVVCGAKNVRPGLKVAFARVGAQLPGITIKLSKLRGVASHGMLCSESELGICETSEGILELPHDAPLGVSVRDYLQLDDRVLDVSITPNRGDCASILGLAREVAWLRQQPLKLSSCSVAVNGEAICPVVVSDTDACPYYAARVIKGINPSVPSPLWLKEQLRRSGLRSTSLIVDVTQWVMLSLGQPLHAFDLHQLRGHIHVRCAKEGEHLRLLNGRELTLNHEALVIADAEHVLALAGIMGGESSAVHAQTTDVFLESAFFNPEHIARTARRFQLQTDAAYRFERAVDPAQQARALDYAAELIIALAGGVVSPIAITGEPFVERVVTVRLSRINRLLGAQFSDQEVRESFVRLAMPFVANEGIYAVTVPSYRMDIRIEEDLIEEILRVRGCHRLQSEPPVARLEMQTLPPVACLDAVRGCLVQHGYCETISYSFVDPVALARLNPEVQPIRLSYPLSQDMSVMRTTLWAGLLSTAVYNIHRQQTRMKLFETGLCFAQTQDLFLAGLAYGTALPQQWGESSRLVDFFDVKADVEALLAVYAPVNSFHFVAEQHPALHPGQTARIYHDHQPCGWLGVLHPRLVQQLDLASAPVLFELSLDYMQTVKSKVLFSPLSKFPSIRRDLALLVDQALPADHLLKHIDALNEQRIVSVQLFDYYQGKGVPVGKKSLAIALVLQDLDKTLEDEEVASIVKTVIDSLIETFNANLRD